MAKNINKDYSLNLEFNFDNHSRIMDICNSCVDELTEKKLLPEPLQTYLYRLAER